LRHFLKYWPEIHPLSPGIFLKFWFLLLSRLGEIIFSYKSFYLSVYVSVRDSNYADHVLSTIEASVSSNAISRQWTMKVDEKYLSICGIKGEKGRYSRPFFFFTMKIGELSGKSGMLNLNDKVEVQYKDSKGNALTNKKFKATLPTGEVKTGTLDSKGAAKLEKVSPGSIRINLDPR
jgi:hypothetical protein